MLPFSCKDHVEDRRSLCPWLCRRGEGVQGRKRAGITSLCDVTTKESVTRTQSPSMDMGEPSTHLTRSVCDFVGKAEAERRLESLASKCHPSRIEPVVALRASLESPGEPS